MGEIFEDSLENCEDRQICQANMPGSEDYQSSFKRTETKILETVQAVTDFKAGYSMERAVLNYALMAGVRQG